MSEPDNGQSDAINKGISYCTGDVFNWLNSDDLLESETLHYLAERFDDPNIDIVSGRELYFEDGQEQVRNGSIVYSQIEKNLLHGVIYQPSTFWRMEALKPLLPIGVQFHYLMDTHLWISYIMGNGLSKIDKVDKVLARFRLHAESKTVGLPAEFIKERWKLRMGVMKHVLPEFTLFDQLLSEKITKHIDLKLPDVKVKVNHERLVSMLADELCYDFYKEFDYQSIRKLMKLAIEEKIFTTRLFQYYLRLNLIPKQILNWLRNG